MTEQILIRMGLDQKEVVKGLTSVQDYLKQWSKKVKTDQERYTDWWASELKKREEMEVSASVRAAERSNRARRLMRQRAQASQARGLANAQAAGETGSMEAQESNLMNFGTRMVGRFSALLRANVYLAALSLVQQLLPTAEEFWDSIYGNTPEQTKAFEATRQRFKTLRAELMESKKVIDQKWADFLFGEATDEGKLKIINQQLKEITMEQAQQLYVWHRFKDSGRDPERIALAAKARKRLNELESEAFDLERKADEVRADKLKKETEIAKAKERQLDLVRDLIVAERAAATALAQARADRSTSTLADIAGSTDSFMGFNRWNQKVRIGPPGQQAAREVMRLEAAARRAALWGNEAAAEQITSRALELRRSIPGLSASERDPLGVLRQKVDESQLKVNQALAKAISPNGAVIVMPQD